MSLAVRRCGARNADCHLMAQDWRVVSPGGPFVYAGVHTLERRAGLVLQELCLLELASMQTSAAEDETLLQTLLEQPPAPTAAPARQPGHVSGAQASAAADKAWAASGGTAHAPEGQRLTEAAAELGMRGREAHECLVTAITFRLSYKRIVLRGLAGMRPEEAEAGVAGLGEGGVAAADVT